jgi:hypothetical protein
MNAYFPGYFPVYLDGVGLNCTGASGEVSWEKILPWRIFDPKRDEVTG